MFGIPKKGDIAYSQELELDLGTVVPSVAGPKRPQDRIELPNLKESFVSTFSKPVTENGFGMKAGGISARTKAEVSMNGHPASARTIGHGSVLIAAITSCTNTSNPSVMLAAGLLAKKAVERGLSVNPVVKASLAPGSRVVTDYLNKTGLQPYLDKLGFNLVGYGCTTCIGNSGPLAAPIEDAIHKHNLVAASVLVRQPQFRGARASEHQGEFPHVAAARRRVCAGGAGGH